MMTETALPLPVTVELIGSDGNPFAILGKVNRAIKKAGFPSEASAYFAEATAGDYNHLLATTMKYVEVK